MTDKISGNPSGSAPLFVLGRFPPPVDGQSLATARLADLLASSADVRRLDVNAQEEGGLVQTEVRWRTDRALHYWRLRGHLRRALRAVPRAPVLWASVSPVPLGHARDVVATLPNVGTEHPLVAVVHRGNFDELFTHPLTRASARRMARRVHTFVFLDPLLSDACATHLAESQRTVIPNAIDDALVSAPGIIAKKRESFAPQERPLRLLFVGHLTESKGFGATLAMARLLKERGVPALVQCAGRWPSEAAREDSEHYVAAHELTESVRLLGPVSGRDALRRLYLWADALVFPTRYATEAQPLVVIEAFASGTPAITTRHASLPTMLGGGSESPAGLLVDGDGEALHQALADAAERLREPERWHALSRSAEARFDARYSADAVRGEWLDLITPLFPDGLAPA